VYWFPQQYILSAVYCAHTYIYSPLTSTDFSYSCHTALPRPHNHSRRGHGIHYIHMSNHVVFLQTANRFCLANLISSVCPSPLVQMFDRLLRSTPAHEGTRLRSTRGYTRAQAPRCDARAPAVSRRHRTARHPRLTPNPKPTHRAQSTELIAPPPSH